MVSKQYTWSTLTGAVLAATLVAQARAGEPTARELIALAPVIDSSDEGCRSLEVGGWFGGDEAAAPKCRFRAVYRAPNEFSLLISDATDGTPLVLCSGNKMLVYDPLGPTVYYSEAATFTLEMACTKADFTFKLDYKLNKSRKHQRIFVDFRSVFSGIEPSPDGGAFGDRVITRNVNEFELVRFFFGNRHSLALKVDLAKICPYTAAAFNYDGKTRLSFNRLSLNDDPGGGPFEFPAKRRLTRALPVKDVTREEDTAAERDLSAIIERAMVIRSVVNKIGPGGAPINIRGISAVDWKRVKENDKKYARILRDLIPKEMNEEKKKGT